MRLGRHGGDLPPEGPGQGSLHDHRLQLAPQLGYRLCHPIHGQRRSWKRQSRFKGLLRLGRLLLYLHGFRLFLYLRDQGSHSRASR